MATGSTSNYSLPYPLSTDPVNVAGDIQDLSDALDTFLTNPSFINNLDIDGGGLTTTALSASVFNSNATTLNIGAAATTLNVGASAGQVNIRGNLNIFDTKVYEINDVTVLSSSALGSGVVSSSLTGVGTITTGTWSATTIAVDKGGTGLTSYTIGDIIYASASTTLSALAGIATGNALISGGVGAPPSWGKIDLTTHVSGVLPVANGGTGVAFSTGSASVVLSDSPTLTGTPISSTASVDTNTTQIATTEFVISQAASASPIMDGTATIGTSLRYARQDHIHPTDTTRAPVASPTFTGIVSSEGTQLIMSSSASGSATESVSFIVERGTDPNVEIRWNELGDGWQFTNDGSTYYDIPTSAGGGTGLQDILMFAGM